MTQSVHPHQQKHVFSRRRFKFYNGPARAQTWIQLYICGVMRRVVHRRSLTLLQRTGAIRTGILPSNTCAAVKSVFVHASAVMHPECFWCRFSLIVPSKSWLTQDRWWKQEKITSGLTVFTGAVLRRPTLDTSAHTRGLFQHMIVVLQLDKTTAGIIIRSVLRSCWQPVQLLGWMPFNLFTSIRPDCVSHLRTFKRI